MANENRGLIHLYYGDGVGKTTAAVGLALRAAGHGKRILFVQFLKEASSGEVFALQKIDDVDIITGQEVHGFVFQLDNIQKERLHRNMRQHWQRAVNSCREGRYDLLVLDEILDTIELGMLSEEEVLGFLSNKQETLEVVLTGHKEYPVFLKKADYVTEMKKHKHPFDQGVPARKGIEW